MQKRVMPCRPSISFEKANQESGIIEVTDIDFSDKALKALIEERDRYFAELMSGSIDAAKRSNLESVSESHILYIASHYRLRAEYKKNAIEKVLFGLGGIFVGVWLQFFIEYFSGKSMPILASPIGVIGAVLLIRGYYMKE